MNINPKAVDEHTKVTDEILAVIDQQPLNRYAVALRLTKWHSKQQLALLDRLAEQIPERLALSNTPDEYARQSALGRNGVITKVELEIEETRKELTNGKQ